MLPSMVRAVCVGADVSVPGGPASCCFASPKSSSRTPVSVSMTLVGFKSRCTMPCRCAVSRASAISTAMGSASATAIGPRSRRWATVSPSRNSMTRKSIGGPDDDGRSRPTSKRVQMLGWLMAATARASRSKRSRCSGLSATWAVSTLTATMRSRRVSVAR